METIVEVLRSPAAQAMGWTLIHSLWQGLLCFLLGTALLRFIPTRKSAMRYTASVGVFGLMLLCSVVTFTIVYTPGVNTALETGALFTPSANSQSVTKSVSPIYTFLANLSSLLSSRIGMVSALWLIGATLFMLRIVSGYWYIGLIRRTAEPVDVFWKQRVNALAAKLDIKSVVELAQSNLISAPVVMGYLKPVILIPVGMFSGLTTEQLEAILVHELMHVRRNDYVVNLLQTALEAIYFFNPFAWVMSANIRREREHCCDDGVVSSQGNAMAYVRALAMLEEAKLSRAGMSLSLAEEKNQLLKRIKRIMEKSVHHYSSRDRMIPALLLVIGLMCASWLTIQSRDRKAMQKASHDKTNAAAVPSTAIDTTGKKKSGTYYHYSVTTIDDKGKEDTHVIEGYGEGEFAGMPVGMEPPTPFAPGDPLEPVEPFESIEPFILNIPNFVSPMLAPPVGPVGAMPQAPVIAPMPMYFHSPAFDTIPGIHGSWEEFGHEFEESFRERFEDFYKEHEVDMKELMKEMENRFGDSELMRRKIEFLKSFEDSGRAEEARARAEEWSRSAETFARRGDAMHMDNIARLEDAQHAVELARVQSKFDEARMLEVEKEMARVNESMKHLEKRLHDAQEVVQKEAIKDGYLKNGEKINTINISNDSMEINGKKVKPADAKRYREIMHEVELEPQHRD